MAAKDDDGDDEKVDLKKFIRMANSQPVPFAAGPGRNGFAFMAHKTKKASDLVMKLKKDGAESNKLLAGTMQVKGSELSIVPISKVSVETLKGLKALLKSNGINLKPKAGQVGADDD